MAQGTPQLVALARSIAASEGVPAELVLAQVEAESNWQPQAYRYEPALKEASYGLLQVLESTARSIGALAPGEGPEVLYDPARGLKAGVRYIKLQLTGTGGDWGKAAAAYNAGPGGLKKAQAKAGGPSKGIEEIDPFLPGVTRKYWRKVLNLAAAYAGKISRAQAVAENAAGEVGISVLEWSRTATGKTVGSLLFLVILAGIVVAAKKGGAA